MKRLFASLLAIGLASASFGALAQSGYDGYDQDYPPPGDYQAGVPDRGDGNTYYDYARVIRVDPVLDRYAAAPDPARRCYERRTAGYYEGGRYGRDDYRDRYPGYDPYYGRDPHGYDDRPYGSRAGSNTAAVIGGIAGAVLGSKIGNGSGSYAAAAVGSMLGSMAGREIYEQNQRDRYQRGSMVRVCEPEPVGGSYAGASGGYDVTYEYNGRQYTRRMDYNPGDRIRVRVDVLPE